MPWKMETTEAEFAALPFDKLQYHHDSHHPLLLSKSTSNKIGVYLKGTLSKEISPLAAKGRAFLPVLYVRQCRQSWVFPK
jgi:hypothetical protein